MNVARVTRIGAYVCPRGVFVIQCRDAEAGVEVERTVEVPFGLRSADDAAEHLASVLNSAGVLRASVCVVVRGFGVAHHMLHLPPAADALLAPVIDREMRRLEPQLGECVVQWSALPPLEPFGTAAPGGADQRSIFATAAPRDLVAAFEHRLHEAGHRLEHLTTAPIAVQRVLEQFDSGTGTIATVVPLPDGAYIGFTLAEGVRLIVDPPLPQDPAHEAAALAEEVELAATFVRQQFRGASIDRVVLIGARPSLAELKITLAERLRIPAKQIEAETLSPVGFVALGAVLDAQAPDPQSLGGRTRARSVSPALSRIESASLVAVFVLALVALWTMAETFRAVRAERALNQALHQIAQEDSNMATVRATAAQRRLVREALDAIRISAVDRVELQSALGGIAETVRAPVHLDSLRLGWANGAWHAVLTGGVLTTSNARAVQLVHDLYRELPQRVPVDSVRLDRLAYGATDGDDSGGSESVRGAVRFQLSFALQSTPRGRP